MRGPLALLFLLGSLCEAYEIDLAVAVDLATAKQRASAATKLARRREVTLEHWLEAMRRFSPKGGAREGPWTKVVPLSVEGRVEQTEVTAYVPAGYGPEQPAPLLLVLHGAGADGRDEYRRWQELADAMDMIVVAPSESGENQGYAFTSRERTAGLEVLRWARRRFNIDERRVHLTGISRGGHMTWDLGLRHPDRFASLAPMVGGPRLDTRGGQCNLRFLENLRSTPIRDLQGEGDDPRLLFNLRLAFTHLKKLGAKDVELITFPGLGHSFRMDAVDWKSFFEGAVRELRPRHGVHLCADPRHGRADWMEILAVERDIKEAFTPQVRPDRWNALDDAGKRRFIVRAAVQRTARLEVVMRGPGVFEAESRGVRRFRLLLDAEMYDPAAPVRVTWKGKTRSKKVSASRSVLLRDFVERFDRTFLPVAEVTIP
ncbi:MAG: carboxylesterase family protein [Planctomycetota bacterium]|jgi:predicted esterase